jgi:hypothetical protein
MGGSSTTTSSGSCDPSDCTFSGSYETSSESHGSLACDSLCFEDDRLKFNYPAGHSLAGSAHSGGSGYSCGCAHGPAEGCFQSLSGEYTTDLLISTAIGKLPDYDDDFDDFFGCFAARNLSEDESSYSLSRFKPKFVIPTARETDLTFCYIEKFQPDDPDTDPTFTLRHATISAGETEVIGDEVREPDENGEIGISGGACACRATLSCDQISASRTKCGYGNSNLLHRYFLGTQTTCNGTNSQHLSCDPLPGFFGFDITITTISPATGTQTLNENDNCTESHSSGSVNKTTVTYICDGGPGNTTNETLVLTLSGGICGGGGTISVSGTTVTVTHTSETLFCVETFDYSNEYTTDQLISNTNSALPSYDDVFDGGCSASRNLSDDESSYSISRFKPKFTIVDALEFDFDIYYNEHFEPDDGEPVDTARRVTIPEGETEIIGDEVTEPDENGTITITDICCP